MTVIASIRSHFRLTLQCPVLVGKHSFHVDRRNTIVMNKKKPTKLQQQSGKHTAYTSANLHLAYTAMAEEITNKNRTATANFRDFKYNVKTGRDQTKYESNLLVCIHESNLCVCNAQQNTKIHNLQHVTTYKWILYVHSYTGAYWQPQLSLCWQLQHFPEPSLQSKQGYFLWAVQINEPTSALIAKLNVHLSLLFPTCTWRCPNASPAFTATRQLGLLARTPMATSPPCHVLRIKEYALNITSFSLFPPF